MLGDVSISRLLLSLLQCNVDLLSTCELEGSSEIRGGFAIPKGKCEGERENENARRRVITGITKGLEAAAHKRREKG